MGGLSDENARPAVWVGHVVVAASDISRTADFYLSLGMREVARNEQVSVLELRGGTHLVVHAGEPAESIGFDLMVEDIDAAHAEWASLGYEPSEIERGRIHDSFTIADPDGAKIAVNSSHVVGIV